MKPALREYRHTLYQFTERWVVDDRRFRDAFGARATPLDEALAATVRWYREDADPQAETAAETGADAFDPTRPR